MSSPGHGTVVLRDPVHGDIELTREEIAVIDTPEFQRLRGIKQLGTAYLVFPGAVHTRFEHSIGTLHMAGRMLEAVNKNAACDPDRCLEVTQEERRVLRLAALVHTGRTPAGECAYVHQKSAQTWKRVDTAVVPLGGG